MIPSGLEIHENAITEEVEKEIIKQVDQYEWSNELRRRVQQYGYSYDYRYKTSYILEKKPITGILKRLCDEYSLKYGRKFDRIIVNEYLRDQGISPHSDANIFGDIIITLSLNDPCNFILEKEENQISLYLKPRTLVVMSGEIRYKWTHSIPNKIWMIDDENRKVRRKPDYRRISVTFRSAA